MDVSDASEEFNGEMESADDLASFEVVNMSNPGLLDFSADVQGSKEKTKLKSKLMSAWHNVRYRGWSLKSKPRLSKSSPVCLLGQSYQLSSTGEQNNTHISFFLWHVYLKDQDDCSMCFQNTIK